MPFDFTDAPPPSFDLIPDGTIATVSIHIRAGNVGEDGMLKRSTSGECEMLDLEFTVLDGPYKGRKFWHNLILTGTTDGQKKMATSNLGVLKAILDSALGLKPNDVSAEARARRTVGLKQFEGMCFIAKIGEEKGGAKKERRKFGRTRTSSPASSRRTRQDWHPVEQPPPFDGGSASAPSASPSAPAAAVERPDWAQ